MRQANGLPSDRRKQQIPGDIALPLSRIGVIGTTIQFDGDLDVIERQVESKCPFANLHHPLPNTMPQAFDVEHVNVTPQLEFTLTAGEEQCAQIAKIAPPTYPIHGFDALGEHARPQQSTAACFDERRALPIADEHGPGRHERDPQCDDWPLADPLLLQRQLGAMHNQLADDPSWMPWLVCGDMKCFVRRHRKLPR